MRNASQGVGFHRVERLRKQKKHSSTALTLSALFHTGKHEKQAVHQLLFGLHMQCIMSVFFRLFRLKGGSGTKQIHLMFVHFHMLNSACLNSTSSPKIILFHKSQKHQTRRKHHAASRKMRNEVQLQKTLVCC